MTDTLIRELVRKKARSKEDPEFAATEQELIHKMSWARRMLSDERLTKQEYAEFEAHCTQEFLEALPVSAFVEMQKDGSYQELEAIARSHDGQRHGTDVLNDRVSLNKKITRDALDTALSEGKISAKRFNDEHRQLGTLDDDMTRRANDANADDDHEEVALDSLLGRLDSEKDWHQADDMDTFAKELIQDVSERESRPGGAMASIDSDAIVAVD